MSAAGDVARDTVSRVDKALRVIACPGRKEKGLLRYLRMRKRCGMRNPVEELNTAGLGMGSQQSQRTSEWECRNGNVEMGRRR